DGVAWNYNQTIGQWFEAGDSVVRIGNFTDTARQGSIYLASDDDGAPFIDVRDGVNSAIAWGSSSTKVRLGKMTGIAGNPWGNQNVYGLYADVAWLTDNVMIGGRALGLMQGLTALFHFDDNLRDSISGINASYSGTLNETTYGLVTSSDNSLVYSKVSGKFGGGVAVEEATTNLLTFSNTFSAGAWVKNNTAVNSDSILGYDNNDYADKLTSAANGSYARQTVTLDPVGKTYTFSVWLKADSNVSGIIKLQNAENSEFAQTNINITTQWQRFTVTKTFSSSSSYITPIIFAGNSGQYIYAYRAHLEQKSYATSYVEGARAAGKLYFNANINPDRFTIIHDVYIDANTLLTGGRRIWELGADANNYLFLATTSAKYLNITLRKNGTEIFAKTGSIAITTGWHKIAVVYSGSAYQIYLDGSAYGTPQASAEKINSSWVLSLGKPYSSDSAYSNAIHDELAVFNRDLSDNEIKKITYSGQPLQESPGMTYISGNKIRTGYIYSENWKSLQTGMMIGLNSAYMEMNFAEKNVFMFDSASATASIAGWGFTYDRLQKVTPTKAIYLISASDTTDLFGLQIDLQYGGGEANKPKWLSVGRIRRGQTVTDNYGFGIFDKDGYPYFESSISAVDNSVTNIMAGWKINASAIWVGGTAPATDGAYAASGMTLGSAGYLSTPNTYITSSGIFYTKSANIAGWSIDASAIYSGTRGANGAYTTSGMTIGS
ncbi:MAG TPA: LamG domain-containing protein, partial [Ignavibacteriales bacterium]|nr:LamG domain-containing protein [Ignavibacteriales bacterium]